MTDWNYEVLKKMRSRMAERKWAQSLLQHLAQQKQVCFPLHIYPKYWLS